MPNSSSESVDEHVKNTNDDSQMEQLQYQLRRYQEIISCSVDWVWEVNAQGQYTFVEGNIDSILGYHATDLLGKTPFDFMPEDEAARIAQLFGEIVKNKAPISDLENWNLTNDGRVICLLTNGTPILDDHGKLLGYRGVDKDITRQKQREKLLEDEIQHRIHAEDSLRVHEQHLENTIALRTRELADKIREIDYFKKSMDEHAIISITDTNGNISYINDKFIEITGYSEHQLLGSSHSLLNSGEHPEEFFTSLWNTLSSGNTWKGVFKNKTRTGEFFWADTTIVPFMDESSKPFQYISIQTDITDQVNAFKSAEKASLAKSEFLSKMSHELRTPLNAILGFSQLLDLDNHLLTDIQQNNVKEIIYAGELLLNLINDLLDLSRIEAGKLELSIQDISIADIADKCIKLISSQAEHQHIDIINHISTHQHIIKADATRLSQALINLLSNAIKYGKDYSQVNLDCEIINPHYLRVIVSDKGKGLTTSEIEKLFIPFERLHTRTNIEGTGIGLAITKHLVELMGGVIGVESIPGEGSSFWIELALSR